MLHKYFASQYFFRVRVCHPHHPVIIKKPLTVEILSCESNDGPLDNPDIYTKILASHTPQYLSSPFVISFFSSLVMFMKINYVYTLVRFSSLVLLTKINNSTLMPHPTRLSLSIPCQIKINGPCTANITSTQKG